MSATPETEWQRRTRRERERDDWLKTHANECEICHRPPKSRGLSQDHDHRTGRTRGWLCHACNRKLWVGVTPEWLRAAAGYLERGGGTVTGSESLFPARDVEELVLAARRAMRLEVLNDLLMLTDGGIVLDSAVLRELIGKVEAATMPFGR